MMSSLPVKFHFIMTKTVFQAPIYRLTLNLDRRAQENLALQEQLHYIYEMQGETMLRFAELAAENRKKRIKSYEDLAERDTEGKKLLLELAQKTKPLEMNGKNIASFGKTSTGKSTLTNGLLEKDVASTGYGETTLKSTPYKGIGYVLWDVRGNNDETSYLSMKYISFLKGLTKRLVMIQSTIKENSSLIKLLDDMNLGYDIVVNKFDLIEESEQQNFKDQIQREIATLQLKKLNKIFYVSAKYRERYPDWQELINYLTN